MTQKVLKVGTSLGVTIPKQTVSKLGIRAGDSVFVDWDRLSIHQKEKQVKGAGRRTKIAKMTADFIDRYRADLEALASK